MTEWLRTPEAANWLVASGTIVLAVATIALAVITYLQLREAGRARRDARDAVIESKNLQTQLRDIEAAREADRLQNERRAAIVTSVQRTPTALVHFAVENRGKGEARNITLTFDGEPLPWAAPIASLGPGAVVVFGFNYLGGDLPAKTVNVTWEDDSELEGRFRTAFHVPLR